MPEACFRNPSLSANDKGPSRSIFIGIVCNASNGRVPLAFADGLVTSWYRAAGVGKFAMQCLRVRLISAVSAASRVTQVDRWRSAAGRRRRLGSGRFIDGASDAIYAGLLLASTLFPLAADANPTLDRRLCAAAKEGSADAIHLLLTQGANANSACRSGDRTMGPLILAVKADSAGAVGALLDGGAQVNSADSKYGLSAIFSTRSAEVGEILLDHGASLVARDPQGGTPFDWLSARVNDTTFPAARAERVAALFLERGADIDDLAEPGDQSPLMTACVLQRSEYAAFLIAHHARVNLRNRAGDTALALVLRNARAVPPEFAGGFRDCEALLRANGGLP